MRKLEIAPSGTKPGKAQFIFNMQLRLLQKALAAWPRRDAPLLVVNCGKGEFLPFIWQSGFDAVATEKNAALRAQAARALRGVEIYAAGDDDLPFEDDSFDWVILHCRQREGQAIRAGLEQALRVARRGLMLAFWNCSSLPAIWPRLRRQRRDWLNNAPSWHEVRDLLEIAQAGRLTALTTLWLPEFCWREGASLVNSWFSWLPIGAWCIMRLELSPLYPVTPLPLRMGGNMEKSAPAFEYAQKNCHNFKGKTKQEHEQDF